MSGNTGGMVRFFSRLRLRRRQDKRSYEQKPAKAATRKGKAGKGALTKRAVMDVIKKCSPAQRHTAEDQQQLQHASQHTLGAFTHHTKGGDALPCSPTPIKSNSRTTHKRGDGRQRRIERQGTATNLAPLKREVLDQIAVQPLTLSEKLTRWCRYTDFFDPQPPPPHGPSTALHLRQRFSMYSGTSLMDWQTFALKRAYRRKTQV